MGDEPPPGFEGFEEFKKQYQQQREAGNSGAAHQGADDSGHGENSPLIVTNPVTLQGLAIPERRWAVPNWLPVPLVTGLYGEGGVGKTILLHMLQTSTTLGRPWLGIPVETMRSLGVYCEDPEEELRRRQADLNQHYGVEMRDLGNMRWISRFGEDNILMEFEGTSRRGKLTPFYGQLVEQIREYQPNIIMLDTVADLFGGNENDRQQVRFFVQVCLGGLARLIDGAVIVSAHPSRAGPRSGEGDSGSTAWNAGFRSRLYLSAPKPNGDDEAPDNDERILARKKANYAPRHEAISLRWQNGVFVPTGQPADDIVAMLAMDASLVEGLRYLIANGAKVSADPNARTGFANAVRRLPSCKRYAWAAVCAAQDRLVARGKLVRVAMGPPSRRYVYIRPDDMAYPGEVAEK